MGVYMVNVCTSSVCETYIRLTQLHSTHMMNVPMDINHIPMSGSTFHIPHTDTPGLSSNYQQALLLSRTMDAGHKLKQVPLIHTIETLGARTIPTKQDLVNEDMRPKAHVQLISP